MLILIIIISWDATNNAHFFPEVSKKWPFEAIHKALTLIVVVSCLISFVGTLVRIVGIIFLVLKWNLYIAFHMFICMSYLGKRNVTKN